MILLPVVTQDINELGKVYNMSTFDAPNLKMSIYKNRRGKYKGIYLWCKANLGTCRIKPIFATTFSYEPVDIKDIHIVFEKESAF